MGFFEDESIIGFDFNFDGKVNMLDDLTFLEAMEEEERLQKEADESDEDIFSE